MPSWSVSTCSVASSGKESLSSMTPSPSSSWSALLPIPSLSVSTVSEGSNGKASTISATPSLSSSSSALLPIPSESLSAHSASLRGKMSSLSLTPSLSSSVSELLPSPSWSVSIHSLGSSGKRSMLSLTPSLSSSGSRRLLSASPSVFSPSEVEDKGARRTVTEVSARKSTADPEAASWFTAVISVVWLSDMTSLMSGLSRNNSSLPITSLRSLKTDARASTDSFCESTLDLILVCSISIARSNLLRTKSANFEAGLVTRAAAIAGLGVSDSGSLSKARTASVSNPSWRFSRAANAASSSAANQIFCVVIASSLAPSLRRFSSAL